MKLLFMINKLIIHKRKRGGQVTRGKILNIIKDIKDGKIMVHWNKLVIHHNLVRHQYENKNNNNNSISQSLEEREKRNLKSSKKLVNQGNIYKAWNRLDSKGSANLNDIEIKKLYRSKYIEGPDFIPKLDVDYEFIKVDEKIMDKLIIKLDPTSGGGADHLSNRIIRQIWNIRNNLSANDKIWNFYQ